MKSMQIVVGANSPIPVEPGLTFREKHEVDELGARTLMLEITASGGRQMCLPHVIETSEGDDSHRVWVLTARTTDALLVLGGLEAYRVAVTTLFVERLPLHRDAADEEYWNIDFHPLGEDMLVVYEGGAILVNADMTVRWHIRKFFTDLFLGSTSELVRFVDDDSTEWTVELLSGRITRQS